MIDFANGLFGAFSALNRSLSDAAQREYAAMTPQERQALWAVRRAELAKIEGRKDD